MKLKVIYEQESDIPVKYAELYSEVGGRWVLQAEGMKTDADIAKLQESLSKERASHKATKEELKPFKELGIDASELSETLDNIDELKILASKGGDAEKKAQELADAKIKQYEVKHQRELAKLQTELNEHKSQVEQFTAESRQRKIHDAVTKVATAAGVQSTALEDIKMLAERQFDIDESGNIITKDNVGVTPLSTPDMWITEIKSSRPHYWPANVGGGATGSNGSRATNPFMKGANFNLTEQNKMYLENPQLAKQMQEQAKQADASN